MVIGIVGPCSECALYRELVRGYVEERDKLRAEIKRLGRESDARLREVEDKLYAAEQEIARLLSVGEMGRAPHRCPVCSGRGTMPESFYGGLPILSYGPCRSCNGTGVIWQGA